MGERQPTLQTHSLIEVETTYNSCTDTKCLCDTLTYLQQFFVNRFSLVSEVVMHFLLNQGHANICQALADTSNSQ